jgi:hypothetical protein
MTMKIRNEELGMRNDGTASRSSLGPEFLIPNSYFLIQDAGSRS